MRKAWASLTGRTCSRKAACKSLSCSREHPAMRPCWESVRSCPRTYLEKRCGECRRDFSSKSGSRGEDYRSASAWPTDVAFIHGSKIQYFKCMAPKLNYHVDDRPRQTLIPKPLTNARTQFWPGNIRQYHGNSDFRSSDSKTHSSKSHAHRNHNQLKIGNLRGNRIFGQLRGALSSVSEIRGL